MPVTMAANHKGGAGKTFILEMLVAELARRGRRVLAIDGDPQANLSRRMGYREADLEKRPTMAEAIQAASPDVLVTTFLPCQWEGDWADRITLAPSRIELENRVSEAGVPGSWLRLRKALGPVAGEFDDVFIDTPPTLGHLLHLPAVVADLVIAPMSPEYDSTRGVHRLIDFITDPENRQALGLHARMAGVVINAQRSGVRDQADRTAAAIEQWGSLVWQPVIPLRASAASAVERDMPPQYADDKDTRETMQAAAADMADRYLAETAA